MTGRRLILGVVLAALLQTGLIGQMIQARAAILRNGQEVVLQTGFIDPRDLFRGHYVRLDLLISSIPADSVPPLGDVIRGEDVWVTLAPGEDGFWTPLAVLSAPPDDAVALRGTFLSDYDGTIRIRFPFDRYFAPELRARELETLRRDRRLGIVLAVTPEGEGAVKGITIDGAAFYDEPLF